MASLINWKACRKFMLEYAERSRHHKFPRVSEADVKPYVESSVRDILRHRVDIQPSKGKTIR